MGLIKGGLLTVVSILLFLSFFAGNIFLTLNWSLEHDVIQSELSSVVKNIAENEMNLNENLKAKSGSMELYCQNNSEYVTNEQGYTLIISCDSVAKGSKAVLEEGINNLVDQIYYQEYDCEFVDCIKQSDTPFFLVSETAKDYWGEKFYFSLVLAIILIIVMFLLVEKKHALFLIVGSLLTVSSLPFMKLNWVLSFISDESFLKFFTSFFTKSYSVFLITFIIGLVILCLGVALKFWGFGNFISNKFVSSKENLKKDVLKK